jgi:hypothetical protein
VTARKFEATCGTNRNAAQIILANAERYDGLPVLWALLWVRRHGGVFIPALFNEAYLKQKGWYSLLNESST